MSGTLIERFYNQAEAQKHIQTFHPDLSVDLMRQSGLFAFYSAKLVKAESQHDRISNAIDILSAKLDRAIREQFATEGKKVTETVIKNEIIQNAKMVQLTDAQRQAREEVGYLKGTCEALRQRKDMLIQMGLLAREERKGDPMIMDHAKESRNAVLRTLSKDDPFIESV